MKKKTYEWLNRMFESENFPFESFNNYKLSLSKRMFSRLARMDSSNLSKYWKKHAGLKAKHISEETIRIIQRGRKISKFRKPVVVPVFSSRRFSPYRNLFILNFANILSLTQYKILVIDVSTYCSTAVGFYNAFNRNYDFSNWHDAVSEEPFKIKDNLYFLSLFGMEWSPFFKNRKIYSLKDVLNYYKGEFDLILIDVESQQNALVWGLNFNYYSIFQSDCAERRSVEADCILPSGKYSESINDISSFLQGKFTTDRDKFHFYADIFDDIVNSFAVNKN